MPTVDEVATMVENLKETFSKKENFKYDDEFDLYYALDTDMDYDIASILITDEGKDCWPAILSSCIIGQFNIHAFDDGEGFPMVIEPMFEIPWAEKKPVRIIYG